MEEKHQPKRVAVIKAIYHRLKQKQNKYKTKYEKNGYNKIVNTLIAIETGAKIHRKKLSSF